MSLSAPKKRPKPKSVKLYWRVIRENKVSLAALGFLAVMKTFRGELGIIPSADTLREAAGGIARDTAFKYIKELEDAGYVTRSRRYVNGQRSSNCYILNDEKRAELLTLNAQNLSPKSTTKPFRPKNADSSTFEENSSSAVQEEPSNVIELTPPAIKPTTYRKPKRIKAKP